MIFCVESVRLFAGIGACRSHPSPSPATSGSQLVGTALQGGHGELRLWGGGGGGLGGTLPTHAVCAAKRLVAKATVGVVFAAVVILRGLLKYWWDVCSLQS